MRVVEKQEMDNQKHTMMDEGEQRVIKREERGRMKERHDKEEIIYFQMLYHPLWSSEQSFRHLSWVTQTHKYREYMHALLLFRAIYLPKLKYN